LQLSLLVQLPVAQGGLDGSACYLTTSASLPTPRLVELLHEHPLLASSHCKLDNIQTCATKTVPSLLHALSEVLPASIDTAKARTKPLKLLVIDSLADLLLEDTKTSSTTLSERSRNLSAIAVQLHALAATHQLAVIALNRVTDVWERRPDADTGRPGELLYDHQARIFGRASEGGSKSAALGLVWANQVNARIMLARTERRHVIPGAASHHDRKRLRVENARGARGAVRADDIVVRSLTVIFSTVCAPTSIDFLVTSRGVQTLADDDDDLKENIRVVLRVPETPARAPPVNVALADISPLDVGSVVNDLRAPQPGDVPTGELDEDEDAYWREVDDLPFVGDNVDLAQGVDPS
jgi:DNA repair protein RAD57